jgi:sec-independent protein translocase protein TatC
MPLDQPDSYEEKEMTFLDHVEELRWNIVRCVIAIFVVTIAIFVAKDFVFDTVIFGPMKLDFWTYRKICDLSWYFYGDDSICIKDIGFTVSNRDMSGQFTNHVFISFVGGLILSFPYILWEVWRFIKPALKPTERRYARGIVFYTSVLFFTGILFGYYFLTPISVNFLGTYKVSEMVPNDINLESYISFVSSLTFATGLVFELPMIVYFLSKLGLITAAFMRKYRRHAFIIIIIVAAVVTPPDVTSQMLMTIPLYGLYELSIFIAKSVERKKENAS